MPKAGVPNRLNKMKSALVILPKPATRAESCQDAVTLFEAGYPLAAKLTVSQHSLSYLELVATSVGLGNSEVVAKAEALSLLNLASAEVLRLLSVREAHRSAFSGGAK